MTFMSLRIDPGDFEASAVFGRGWFGDCHKWQDASSDNSFMGRSEHQIGTINQTGASLNYNNLIYKY